MKEFEEACPIPKPPTKTTKDGIEPIVNDPTYKLNLEKYAERRMSYTVLKSLEPSEIEWETVFMDNPKTWPNWETELRAAGFSDIEVQRMTMCVLQANSLDESKLKAAREVFLHGLEAAEAASSGPQIGQ
jgi:hypothetical protein